MQEQSHEPLRTIPHRFRGRIELNPGTAEGDDDYASSPAQHYSPPATVLPCGGQVPRPDRFQERPGNGLTG